MLCLNDAKMISEKIKLNVIKWLLNDQERFYAEEHRR
jgi:hypothetical protein